MEAIDVLRKTRPVVTLVLARVNEQSYSGSEGLGDMKPGLSEDDLSAAISNSDNYGQCSCPLFCIMAVHISLNFLALYL